MLGERKLPLLSRNDVSPALDFIDAYWRTLTRRTTSSNSTLIELPNAYVVPSGESSRFAFEEQYYWDSFFTSLGINNEKLVSGTLDNLISLFERFGMIPNANRYYLTSRSQPPILTTYIFHVYEKYHKSTEWLNKRISVAKKEYETVWMSDKHPHHHQVYKGLSRYYDINCLHDLAEAESGWDMTPRFKRQCLDYLPIDLNCMLYKYEMDFAKSAALLDNDKESKQWQRIAHRRKKTITKVLWSRRQGFFFDYNYNDKELGKVWSLAAYFALWSGLATDTQAKKLVQRLERFIKKGGLTTTVGNYMYYSLFGSAKTQWAYPNGWAPLHYVVIEGLERYGYRDEARQIAHLWLKNCNDWFQKQGHFQEKYNVVEPKKKPADGLYPPQKGFGWTNGVFVYLAQRYTMVNS